MKENKEVKPERAKQAREIARGEKSNQERE